MEQIDKYLKFRQNQMGKIDPKKTALLVIDMQKYQVQRNWTLFKAVDGMNPGMLNYFVKEVEEKVVPNLKDLIQFCHDTNIPVIYTKYSSFRPDGSDLPGPTKKVNDVSRNFLGDAAFPYITHEGSEIIEELEVDGTKDWILQKNTSGTFISTKLDHLLRNMGIEVVIVTGVVTHFCVESTAREASDYGFEVYIIDDCCAGWSPELHEVALKTFGLLYGYVFTLDKLKKTISKFLKKKVKKAPIPA